MEKGLLMKARILKESVYLFENHGYNNTTIRMISDRVGIGRGNLTYHFPLKEDINMLLMRVFFLKIEKYSKNYKAINLSDAFEYFAFILIAFEKLIQYSGYFQMMMDDSKSDQHMLRHSIIIYPEILQRKFLKTNSSFDSEQLESSAELAGVIFNHIVTRNIGRESASCLEASKKAVGHFMYEYGKSQNDSRLIYEKANQLFEKLDFDDFYHYIMGSEYEELIKEIFE